MKNSADLGGCYLPRPSALVDNTLLDLQNSSYPTQPHSIIAKYCILKRRVVIVVEMIISYLSVIWKMLFHTYQVNIIITTCHFFFMIPTKGLDKIKYSSFYFLVHLKD